MAKKVLSIGFAFPGRFAEYVPVTAKRSLLDSEVIIFRPSIEVFQRLNYPNGFYKGKPSLDDDASFELKEAANHWRQQIQIALNAGRNVFIYLAPREEVWVDTGERTYSGTGKNQRATRHVEIFDNYRMFPSFYDKVVSSEGEQMKLTERGKVLEQYWNEFGDMSKYNVVFPELKLGPIVTTAVGDVPVGSMFTMKGAKGTVLALPTLHKYDVDPRRLDIISSDEYVEWTKEDKRFGQRLLKALLAIDVSLRAGVTSTPPPDWASRDAFLLTTERELMAKILTADSKIEKALAEKATLSKRLVDEGGLRALLYEKGRPLETAILAALRILGFDAEPFQNAESEFDAVFTSAEGRFLGEAEGKDAKAINVDKLRQLEMNIQEDFAREDVLEYAKGVLFGNAYRLQPPNERAAEFFTEKCVTAAQRSGAALVRTPDLFFAAQHIKNSGDTAYAAACRRAILDQSGAVVSFPMPEPEVPIAG